MMYSTSVQKYQLQILIFDLHKNDKSMDLMHIFKSLILSEFICFVAQNIKYLKMIFTLLCIVLHHLIHPIEIVLFFFKTSKYF